MYWRLRVGHTAPVWKRNEAFRPAGWATMSTKPNEGAGELVTDLAARSRGKLIKFARDGQLRLLVARRWDKLDIDFNSYSPTELDVRGDDKPLFPSLADRAARALRVRSEVDLASSIIPTEAHEYRFINFDGLPDDMQKHELLALCSRYGRANRVHKIKERQIVEFENDVDAQRAMSNLVDVMIGGSVVATRLVHRDEVMEALEPEAEKLTDEGHDLMKTPNEFFVRWDGKSPREILSLFREFGKVNYFLPYLDGWNCICYPSLRAAQSAVSVLRDVEVDTMNLELRVSLVPYLNPTNCLRFDIGPDISLEEVDQLLKDYKELMSWEVRGKDGRRFVEAVFRSVDDAQEAMTAMKFSALGEFFVRAEFDASAWQAAEATGVVATPTFQEIQSELNFDSLKVESGEVDRARSPSSGKSQQTQGPEDDALSHGPKDDALSRDQRILLRARDQDGVRSMLHTMKSLVSLIAPRDLQGQRRRIVREDLGLRTHKALNIFMKRSKLGSGVAGRPLPTSRPPSIRDSPLPKTSHPSSMRDSPIPTSRPPSMHDLTSRPPSMRDSPI